MKVWILFAIIFFTACTQPPFISHRSEKEKAADHILGKVAYQMKREANLRPCGTMGQMMNEIEILGLSFFYFQPVDIAEARKLAVQAVEAMVKEINQEPRIRPFLCRYPFKPRNVQIEIFFRNPDNSDLPPDALQVLVAGEGTIRYKIRHPTRPKLLMVYKETYQEALDRLADPTLPLASFEPPPELTPEELTHLRKSIYYLSNDGTLHHPNAEEVGP